MYKPSRQCVRRIVQLADGFKHPLTFPGNNQFGIIHYSGYRADGYAGESCHIFDRCFHVYHLSPDAFSTEKLFSFLFKLFRFVYQLAAKFSFTPFNG